MVKKASKSKTRKGGAAASSPMAALYHLDAGTSRGDAVRAVLAQQGIRVKTVTEEQLGSPVGAIAGLTGLRMSSKPYVGEVPSGEFMLLHNLSSARTSQLLDALREAEASVGCKAQVTQHNRLWPFATLVTEVTREHEAMTSAKQEPSANAEPGGGGQV